MGEQVHIHRAVLVPRRNGCDVYPSVEHAPEKVRRTLEHGQAFTIVIAERSAVEHLKQSAPPDAAPWRETIPVSLVREALVCFALAAAILILAVSR